MERLHTGHFAYASLADEHVHRYRLARAVARGFVVDCACGIGYGSEYLASASEVTRYLGVDPSPEALAHAIPSFGSERVAFANGTLEDLPGEAQAIDTFVMLETLEHVEHPAAALAAVAGRLAPDGLLVGSVPSKFYEQLCETAYSPNPYHLQRFSYSALRELLSNRFESHVVFSAELRLGTLFAPVGPLKSEQGRIVGANEGKLKRDIEGSFYFFAGSKAAVAHVKKTLPKHVYFASVSKARSDLEEKKPLRMALQSSEALVTSRDRTIQSQALLVASRDETIENQARLIEARDEAIESQTRLIEARDETIKSQTRLIDARDETIESQVRLIQARDETIENQARLIEARDEAIESQTRLIEAREETIKSQTRLIEARDETIESQTRFIDDRDAAIASQAARILDLQTQYASALETLEILKRLLENRDASVADQAAMISAWDTALKSQTELIDSRDAALMAQAAMIDQRGALIIEMEDIINARDEGIAAQTRMIDERDALIRHQEQLITSSDFELGRKSASLHIQDDAIECLLDALAAGPGTMARDERALDNLANKIRVQYKQWAMLNDRVKDLEQTIVDQAALVDERDAYIRKLEAMVEQNDRRFGRSDASPYGAMADEAKDA